MIQCGVMGVSGLGSPREAVHVSVRYGCVKSQCCVKHFISVCEHYTESYILVALPPYPVLPWFRPPATGFASFFPCHPAGIPGTPGMCPDAPEWPA